MDERRRFIAAKRPVANIVDGVPIANVGDIAYYANGEIKTVAPDKWDTSLGTAVGVVVIPSGFAPDNGLARIVSLLWVTIAGESSASFQAMPWSVSNTNTPLTNYTAVPYTNNEGYDTTRGYNYGILPSDSAMDGEISYVDPAAKYGKDAYMIPSPYLGDKPNPAYYAAIANYNNALSDFDGKGNSDTLVSFGTYYAAHAAIRYKAAGAESIEWYLPAMGELGYLVVRTNKIQATLTKLGASLLEQYYWSSTEYSSSQAWNAYKRNDNMNVYCNTRSTYLGVRPFAMLDF